MLRLVRVCSAPTLLGLAILLGEPRPTAALDRDKRLSQFIVTTWTRAEGLRSSRITALAQTRDGFIWVGTDAGLVRFDGVRFERVDQGIPTVNISALGAASDGALWIGTTTGHVIRLADGASSRVDAAAGAPRGYVETIVEGPDGRVWVGTAAGLAVYESGVWHPAALTSASASARVLSVAPDAHAAWVGTNEGLVRWPAPTARLAPPADGCRGIIRSVVTLGSGAIWVADMAGSVRSIDTRCRSTATLQEGPTRPWRLLQDRDGALWVGTLGQGLWRIAQPAQASSPEAFDAGVFPDDRITALLEDREGNLWVGTDAGLARVTDGPATTFGPPEGLSSSFINSVVAAPDGSILVGSPGGVDRIRDGRVRQLMSGEAMGLALDATGRLWIGRREGVSVLDTARASAPSIVSRDATRAIVLTGDGASGVWIGDWGLGALHWTTAGLRRIALGPAGTRVSAAELDRHGRLWLGLTEGGIVRVDGAGASPVSIDDPLPGGGITDIHEDREGALWVAAVTGVIRIDPSGAVRAFDRRHGLPDGPIVSIVDDRHGDLWLTGVFGVARVQRGPLIARSPAGIEPHAVTVFDVDGFRASPTAGASPRAVIDGRGDLWVATTRGVVRVDLDRLREARAGPPVRLLTLQHDGTLVNLATAPEPRLPSSVKAIRIAYTALSFSAPQRVRFRYRLDGDRGSWVGVGTTREIVFDGLSPGAHRLEIAAAHGGGAWADPPAVLTFTIAPAFYQTTWFATLAISGLGAALWGLHRLRVARVSATLTRRLEDRAAERLRIAHELHDTLLQSATAVGMHLQVIRDAPPQTTTDLQRELDGILRRVDQMSDEARATVAEIRSASAMPVTLVSSLEQLVQQLQAHTAAAIRMRVSGQGRSLSPPVHGAAYRITREALLNAGRHARASRITLDLEFATRHIRIAVRDDGIGVDPEVLEHGKVGHFGLVGMQERARSVGATVRITSMASRGTTVELTIPIT
ncbi:histidine kinase [Luteitalea sp. TBR-22]|uniref:sensor histidine kinase n=1 Tax=Luteitalea sp. TBR-22 TaxID=2802971 RepID=UPI001AFC3BB7|nr:two-component regulator propeller domain-containing protein [Luteitalea sp. TBR-22]BCS35041.1 histidine kinase [Luteitalea sp. TBR-22]